MDDSFKGKHDSPFDGLVLGAVIHYFFVRVKQVPCRLCIGLVITISDELGKGGCSGR